MRKIYLGVFALFIASVGFSQHSVIAKSSQAKNAPAFLSVANSNDKNENNVAKAIIFQEDFDTWPLTGWTIQGGPASTTTQPTQKWHQNANGNPGSCASILYVNSIDQHDEQLISPSISLPSGGNYYFTFDFNTSIYWHALALGGVYDNADIFLQASIDGGTTWSGILWQEDDLALLQASFSDGWETYVWKKAYVNVSSYAGEDVIFRFTYYGMDAAQFNLDNVVVEDIEDHDIRVTNFYQAVDTPEAGDYYIVPASQVSFPGLTFGANAQNIGAQDQSAVTLRVTGDSYDESSAPVSINVGAIDSLSITAPFAIPAAVGDYTIAMTTELGSETDANPANNSQSIVVRRDPYVYARDNGVYSGGISQVTSQTNLPLSIGNIVEVFDDLHVTAVQVRLANQPEAVGQVVDAKIEIYDSGSNTFVALTTTEVHDIVTEDLSTFVTIPVVDGSVTIPGGSIILVMANHYGGNDEVLFGMAQPTYQGSVMGRTADGQLFNLTSPRAIMVRLTEDPTLSVANVAALQGVKVYPNPSTGVINVSNDLNVENTIIVTDISGKVVTTKVSSVAATIDLGTVGAGIYLVEVANQNGKKVERVIIR